MIYYHYFKHNISLYYCNEHTKIFVCVKLIYIDMLVFYYISWHLNINVKMLLEPHIHYIGRIFGGHLGDHLVCNVFETSNLSLNK